MEVPVGVKDNSEETHPDRFREILADWFRRRQPTTVRLVENLSPKSEPYEDYTVVCAISFEPDTLECMRAEVWLTTEGGIAVGLEKRDRIAQRLSIKNRQEGFAAGHEPRQITQEGLIALLTLVANGELAIATTTFPIWGLYKSKAVVRSRFHNVLLSKGYDCSRWLVVLDEFQPSDLQFNPW